MQYNNYYHFLLFLKILNIYDFIQILKFIKYHNSIYFNGFINIKLLLILNIIFIDLVKKFNWYYKINYLF